MSLKLLKSFSKIRLRPEKVVLMQVLCTVVLLFNNEHFTSQIKSHANEFFRVVSCHSTSPTTWFYGILFKWWLDTIKRIYIFKKARTRSFKFTDIQVIFVTVMKARVMKAIQNYMLESIVKVVGKNGNWLISKLIVIFKLIMTVISSVWDSWRNILRIQFAGHWKTSSLINFWNQILNFE